MRAWILVGMMGAGKSTVGKALAEQAGRRFVDTDLILSQRFGRTVGQIFDVYGEDAFRAHETNVLAGLEPGPHVVSTGGGIVTREENWTHLRRLGLIAYLRADADTLARRLEASKRRRPLLEKPDWRGELERLLERREPLYRQADLVLEVHDGDLEEAAAQALVIFREHDP